MISVAPRESRGVNNRADRLGRVAMRVVQVDSREGGFERWLVQIANFVRESEIDNGCTIVVGR